MQNQTAFKSDQARKNALATYDEILSQWQVPCESRMIKTSFGETHVLALGSPDAKPLVLLHGGGGNSTMWSFNVPNLAKHFRVYAVDIIGEAGKSAGTRPGIFTDGYSRWLKEVFDVLAINKAALCGASLGGTIAHQFALQFPQCITSLILLAPPSLLKMRPSFLFRAIIANVFPTSYFARSFLKYMSSRAPKFSESSIQAFVIQFQAYKPHFNKIPVITDHDLTRLPTNTVVLLGEDEILYDVNAVASRIRSIAPFIRVAMIPGAKHTISVDQPDLVDQIIIEYGAMR